ncbi:MAG: hypothetical protein HZC29_05700 [Thaumarchaeota archaeon]|nr:hypothetical protein [Nitrososphaerota archaeon]
MRYFLALGAAFAVLTVFSVFHHYKMMTKTSIAIVAGETPHFYNPVTINDKTLQSKFSVQIWETLPHFLFGVLYFSMLFSDRVISWLYHPAITESRHLIEFNSAYHMGADLALLVILSASMLQFVIMGPIHIRLNNVILRLTAQESGKIDTYLQKQYRDLLILSTVTSAGVASLLIFFAPQIMSHLGGTEKSTLVLQIAAFSNIFLSIFATNGIFVIFLNRVKSLFFISAISTAIIIISGMLIGVFGYEYIVFAYLASAIFSSAASTVYVKKIMKKASSRFFSRYV